MKQSTTSLTPKTLAVYMGRMLLSKDSIDVQSVRFSSLWIVIISGLAMLVSSGCANRVIRASKMPARYQAALVTNAQVADLSRLSMPTTSSSLIEAEDVVDVTITSGIETASQMSPTPVRVDSDGMAMIALVGSVRLAGLEPFQAEQEIASAAVDRGLYRAPQVTVTMKKKAVNRITVIGAVGEQGVQELPRSHSTLLDALVAAGSLNEKAGTIIEVKRHSLLSEQVTMVDQEEFVEQGEIQLTGAMAPFKRLPGGGHQLKRLPVPMRQQKNNSPQMFTIDLANVDAAGRNNIGLQDGDVVRVETRDPTPISVIGLVNKPGQYEMPVGQPVHVLDAIAMAGERNNAWADKIYITRHVQGENEPVVIQTSVADAQHRNEYNIRLSPGDVVSVEKTPQTVLHTIFTTIVRFSIVAGRSVPLF
ncbi:MAG: polysaccharide biosynthesis/export family protein [Pirellulales bacterium]